MGFLFDFPSFRRTAESSRWCGDGREVRVVRFTQGGSVYFMVEPSISDEIFEYNIGARGNMAPVSVMSESDHIARWFFNLSPRDPHFDPRDFKLYDRREMPFDSVCTHRCIRDWQRTLVREKNGRGFRGWGPRANPWGGF